MAQAYVIVVFIFNSLSHSKPKLETWLNYYLKSFKMWDPYILEAFSIYIGFISNKMYTIILLSSIMSVMIRYAVNKFCSHIFTARQTWTSHQSWIIFPDQNKGNAYLEYYSFCIEFSWFFLTSTTLIYYFCQEGFLLERVIYWEVKS